MWIRCYDLNDENNLVMLRCSEIVAVRFSGYVQQSDVEHVYHLWRAVYVRDTLGNEYGIYASSAEDIVKHVGGLDALYI